MRVRRIRKHYTFKILKITKIYVNMRLQKARRKIRRDMTNILEGASLKHQFVPQKSLDKTNIPGNLVCFANPSGP